MTLTPEEITIIFKITLATVLAGFIGYEREHWHKPGGLRTYMLVGIGSVLFTIISSQLVFQYMGLSEIDPTRLTVGIITGIGFIGAGMVMHKGGKTYGLTTAAGIWVTSAVAMSVGYGYYLYAVYTTLLAFFCLTIIGGISKGKIDKAKIDATAKNTATNEKEKGNQ